MIESICRNVNIVKNVVLSCFDKLLFFGCLFFVLFGKRRVFYFYFFFFKEKNF